MSRKAHAQSFILPISVCILIPSLILFLSSWTPSWFLPFPFNYPASALSITSIVAGIYLLAITIRIFATIGQGTLAPWNPTKKLVVHGIYRYVRNPMISGVLLILLGESVLFGSPLLFLWSLFFLIGNHFYFIRSEEPGLVKRFGDEYIRYAQNVPRWIPRRTPWNCSSDRL
ncbi:MAG: methyltransferase family protein [Candidatus Thorarchaeota archaeon]